MRVRASGILAHLSSLPSDYGIGDMGPCAREFVTFLAGIRQSYWQILPLCPTSSGMCHSPYGGYSAFAGNPLFISPEMLVEEGFLTNADLPDEDTHEGYDPRRVSYTTIEAEKRQLLELVFERHGREFENDLEFKTFCQENGSWLEDFALFSTLKQRHNGASWESWPKPLRFRDAAALDKWSDEGAEALAKVRLEQYLFQSQWNALKLFCNENGVNIIGDLPIYVTYDSADVWAHPGLYRLDEERRPTHVAGVPPDYFSATGQRWGNPVYNWEAHRSEGFSWWVQRFLHDFQRFDFMRVDHFRGFAAYWSIPASEPTAVNGTWEESPGEELFNTLLRRCGSLPLIAEDLGVITAEVRELKQRFDLPGMKILQFAFGDEWSKHVPHMHDKHAVIFTGTHDNNTVRGWFTEEASQAERQTLARYLGHPPSEDDAHVAFIRMGLQSVGNTAIFPMQDILGLGAEHRMNTPATIDGNWEWRMLPSEVSVDRLAWFKEMTVFFDRA